MNTLHFKYAVEVERTRSISQAAENLFMAQPNLSKVIKELEDSLGHHDIRTDIQRGRPDRARRGIPEICKENSCARWIKWNPFMSPKNPTGRA